MAPQNTASMIKRELLHKIVGTMDIKLGVSPKIIFSTDEFISAGIPFSEKQGEFQRKQEGHASSAKPFDPHAGNDPSPLEIIYIL